MIEPTVPTIIPIMIGSHVIEGYAIVSADGMIADGSGSMPDCIRNDADQHFLQTAMDQATVLIHGRHSHEGGPRAAKRKRLVVTRQVPDIAPDPSQPNAMLWNPAGASLEAALGTLHIDAGPIAIIGGTEVFDLFLPRYDVFYLTRAERAEIPGGRPLFSAVGRAATVDDVLIRSGLRPGPPRDIDAAAGVTLTEFRRVQA
jgi:dihydrofolate reductase